MQIISIIEDFITQATLAIPRRLVSRLVPKPGLVEGKLPHSYQLQLGGCRSLSISR